MQCTTCGYLLQTDMAVCPNCGAPVTRYTTNPIPYTGTDSGPANPYAYSPYVESSSVPGNSYPNTSQPAYPNTPGVPTYTNPQYYNAGQPPAYPPTPAYTNYAGQPPIYPDAPYTPGTQMSPHRRFSPGIIALLLFLLVLIVGGSGLIYYALVAQPAQSHAQATAIAQTVLAQSHASTPTPATPQDQYNQVTSGTPTLTDPLTSQDYNQWDQLTGSLGGKCAFADGAYHVSMPKVGYFRDCFATATNFSNFAYQVQMKIISGSAGGILFRADDVNSKFYYFRLRIDGSYRLYSYQGRLASQSHLLQEGYVQNFHTDLGQTNLIATIANGTNIYLYVNKQFVAGVSDTDHSYGKIGMFASASTDPTEAIFSNVQVWKLP